jgi:hypothetical protein
MVQGEGGLRKCKSWKLCDNEEDVRGINIECSLIIDDRFEAKFVHQKDSIVRSQNYQEVRK